MNRKLSYLLSVCVVAPIHLAVAAPQKAASSDSPCCKKPAYNTITESQTSACEAKRGSEFNGLAAKPKILFDGMMACRALENAWRDYCTCWDKKLRAEPVTDPKDLRFKVLACSTKPAKSTLLVHCGHFACEEEAPPTEPTSSRLSQSSRESISSAKLKSRNPDGIEFQDTLMCEYVP